MRAGRFRRAAALWAGVVGAGGAFAAEPVGLPAVPPLPPAFAPAVRPLPPALAPVPLPPVTVSVPSVPPPVRGRSPGAAVTSKASADAIPELIGRAVFAAAAVESLGEAAVPAAAEVVRAVATEVWTAIEPGPMPSLPVPQQPTAVTHAHLATVVQATAIAEPRPVPPGKPVDVARPVEVVRQVEAVPGVLLPLPTAEPAATTAAEPTRPLIQLDDRTARLVAGIALVSLPGVVLAGLLMLAALRLMRRTPAPAVATQRGTTPRSAEAVAKSWERVRPQWEALESIGEGAYVPVEVPAAKG